jgi:hypothetical protein
MANLAPGSMPSKNSRGGTQIQILKGKKPIINSEGPISSLVPICGKCTRALFASRSCKDWIKCFSCGNMGHVDRHCKAKWKKVIWKDSLPNSVVKHMSTTMRKIWLAKDSHAGGASGSKASILDTLNEASIEAGLI